MVTDLNCYSKSLRLHEIFYDSVHILSAQQTLPQVTRPNILHTKNFYTNEILSPQVALIALNKTAYNYLTCNTV